MGPTVRKTSFTDPIVSSPDPLPKTRVAGWIASAFAYAGSRRSSGASARFSAPWGEAARTLDESQTAGLRSRSPRLLRHRSTVRSMRRCCSSRSRGPGGIGFPARLFEGEMRTEERDVEGLPLPGRIQGSGPRLSPGARTADSPGDFPRPVLFPRPRGGIRLQAVEPLHALDGTPRPARPRALEGDPDGSARDPDGHPYPPRLAPSRPDPPAHGGLEDGAADHGPARAVRPGRSRPFRLRALPDRHLRRLPARPGPLPVPGVRGRGGVPGGTEEAFRRPVRGAGRWSETGPGP